MSDDPSDTDITIWKTRNHITWDNHDVIEIERAWYTWADQARTYATQTCDHPRDGQDPLDNGGLGDPDGDGCDLNQAYDLWSSGYSPSDAVFAMRDTRTRFDDISNLVGDAIHAYSRPFRQWVRSQVPPMSFRLLGITGDAIVRPIFSPAHEDMFMFVARVTYPSGRTDDLAFAGINTPAFGGTRECVYWVTNDFTPDAVPRAWQISGSAPETQLHDYNLAFGHGVTYWQRTGAPPSTLPATLVPPQTQADTAASIAAQATPNPASTPAQPAPPAMPAGPAVSTGRSL